MVSEKMRWTGCGHSYKWSESRTHTSYISNPPCGHMWAHRDMLSLIKISAGTLAALWPWLWPFESGSSAVSMAAEALEEEESLADSPQALCADHRQRLTSLRAFSHRERTFVGEFSLQTRFWIDIIGFYFTSCTNIHSSSNIFLAH